MDVRATRLMEDLSDLFRGELHVDPLRRALYATDASLYQVLPLAVACPQDRDDVVTLVRYAAEQRLPLFPRGGGRGVAGSALGEGVVVDFSRHMHRIGEITATTVRVEPGVVHERLNRELRQHGRYFAPDPSSTATTTVGSMLALDAAGAHSIGIGSTRDHVAELELVLADGQLLAAQNAPVSMQNGAYGALPGQLVQLLQRHSRLIEERRPRGLFRNRAGYCVWDVWRDGKLDLPRLLVGSEGTLGLFTSATLQTLPLPEHRGAALLVFSSLDAAVRAVPGIVLEEPSACDLLDRRLLNLVRESTPELEAAIPREAEAALIVEWPGWSSREVQHRLAGLQRWANEYGASCQLRYSTTTPEGVQRLWSQTTRVVPTLDRLPGPTRAVPFVEDIAVPPAQLEEFVVRARKVLQQHEITATLYAHAAAGQLHLRPFLSAPRPADGPKLDVLAHDLYDVAWQLGGTVSGEHGTGLSRSAFLRRQYGPLYDVFREIKHLFDPHRLLNPGKVITDDPQQPQRHFRPQTSPPAELQELQLRWSPQELQTEAARCNGCGQCRTAEPSLRMCPFFRLDADEAASPRAKANLVRHALTETLPAHALGSPEFKQLADLCFNCKQCQLECPAGVDIPHLVLEAKAQHVALHGLTRSQWFISRVPNWTNWLTRLSPLVNLLQRDWFTRWLLERFGGVARRRKLPPWSNRTFLQAAPAEWLKPPAMLNEQTVVYFVDHFANAHDPALGLAFGRILEHLGIPLHVPPRQQRCGMDFVTLGDVESARTLAEHNVRLLVDFAQAGCPIVCTEPSAAVCLRFEYPLLLGTPEAALVASRVVEAGAFLAEIHRQGKLRTDFQPLEIHAAYHTPCHLKALGPTEPLWELCRLIPQLQTPKIEEGCSGMAGAFGLSALDFDVSLQIGRGLCASMQAPTVELGLSECSSCRMQMEQTVDKPALHPLKLLAWAYGLTPPPVRLRKPRQPTAK